MIEYKSLVSISKKDTYLGHNDASGVICARFVMADGGGLENARWDRKCVVTVRWCTLST